MKSTVPENDQKRISDFLDSQLDKQFQNRDIKWPNEQASVTINVNVSSEAVTAEPEKKDDTPRDERTGLPIVHGLTVGLPDEAAADKLRDKPLFPRLPRQAPDLDSGMNQNNERAWQHRPSIESTSSPLDRLPEQVSGEWKDRNK